MSSIRAGPPLVEGLSSLGRRRAPLSNEFSQLALTLGLVVLLVVLPVSSSTLMMPSLWPLAAVEARTVALAAVAALAAHAAVAALHRWRRRLRTTDLHMQRRRARLRCRGHRRDTTQRIPRKCSQRRHRRGTTFQIPWQSRRQRHRRGTTRRRCARFRSRWTRRR